jgi:hypothetical protein
VELIIADLSRGKHNSDDNATLIRIRDCIRDRKPLREIEERMDRTTGEPTVDRVPFDDPYNDAKNADEPSDARETSAQSVLNSTSTPRSP